MNSKKKSNVVSAFDAKTHLSRLLQETEQGAVITITRRGKPVARLVPVDAEQKPLGPEDVLKGFKEIRSRIKGRVNIRSLIDEGRRR